MGKKKVVDPALEALEASDVEMRAAAAKEGPVDHEDMLEEIFDGAFRHGGDSDREHEAGDLREALREAWKLLTPAQRKTVYSRLDLWRI